jgi:broad specificity phosphatase PhoE
VIASATVIPMADKNDKTKTESQDKSKKQSQDKSKKQSQDRSKKQSQDRSKEQSLLDTKVEGGVETKADSEELHPLETITNILLIRHGHTQATQLGLLYSDPHMPLTDKGVEQSKLAAKWAKSFHPDVILTGKALRVSQAAEPLAQLTGIIPTVIAGFEEWHVGKWEGRTYLDIKKNDPEQYHAWCADPVNNAPPGGESIDDLVQRIGKSLLSLVMSDEYGGKNIAMVTHSGIIRSIIVHALDMPTSNFWRLSVPTGSVSRVNFSKNFALLQYCGLVPEAAP